MPAGYVTNCCVTNDLERFLLIAASPLMFISHPRCTARRINARRRQKAGTRRRKYKFMRINSGSMLVEDQMNVWRGDKNELSGIKVHRTFCWLLKSLS